MNEIVNKIGELYSVDRNRAMDMVMNNIELLNGSVIHMNGKIPVDIFSGFVLSIKYTKDYIMFNSDSYNDMEDLNRIDAICKLFS